MVSRAVQQSDETTAGIGFVVDEDAMTSNTDTKVPTQQSVKAYADGKVSDTAYNATTWDAVTGVAPSKNAVRDQVELLAPKASPTFTGTVTLPSDQALPGNPTTTTQSQGNNSTRIATTAYVQTEVGLLVPKSLFDANTILYATTDNTPAALTVGASTFVGRKASGDISAMSVAEAGTLLGTYSTYNPTVAQNGAKTTSSATGRYLQIGKYVHAYGTLTLSQAGTSGQAITVSLPVAFASNSRQIGTGEIQRVAANVFYRGIVAATAGTQDIRFFQSASTTDAAEHGANPAYALASGNIISWNVTYEAA